LNNAAEHQDSRTALAVVRCRLFGVFFTFAKKKNMAKLYFRFTDHNRCWWLMTCEITDSTADEEGRALWRLSFYLDSEPENLGYHLFSALERFEFPPTLADVSTLFAQNFAAVAVRMAIDGKQIDRAGKIII
jgi:hypothetical protein